MKTKLFTLLLALITNVGFIFAQSGTCGDSLTWVFNPQDSTLTISGTGNMTNWEDETSVPWRSYRMNITSVIIGNSVTSIGDLAFYNCSVLTSVTISNSVTSIGNIAFGHCSGLTRVTIPNSVTIIGNGAFSHCSGLTSVTIPNSVTSIGDNAFTSCSRLTSVTIPNSVTSIGEYAFWYCSRLVTITCEATTPPSCGTMVFAEVSPSACIVFVPAASISAYQTAAQWSRFSHFQAIAEPEEEEPVIPSICHRYGKLQVTGSNGMTVNILNLDGTATSLGSVNITSDYQEISLLELPMGDYRVEWNNQTMIVFNPDGAWWVTSRTYNDSIPCAPSDYTLRSGRITLGETCLFGCQLITPTEAETYIYYDSLTNVCGEDSVIVLTLMVNQPCLPSVVEFFDTIRITAAQNANDSIQGRHLYLAPTNVNETTALKINHSGNQSICHSYGKLGVTGSNGMTVRVLNLDGSATSIADTDITTDNEVDIDLAGLPAGYYKVEWAGSILYILNYGRTNTILSLSEGESILFGCQVITPVYAGDYSYTETYVNYCGYDSLVTLNLTVQSEASPEIVNPVLIGDLYYNLNPDSLTAEVTSSSDNYSGLTIVTIPSAVSYNSVTYSVTNIGYQAFYGCSDLTSIIIPNSITSIGYEAFENCSGLTSLTIGNSVTRIENEAFYNCFGLTSIEIPNSVTSIGNEAFVNCIGLTSIVVENGNTIYDSRDNSNAIIETATNTLLYGCQNTIIPNSVTSIMNYAFWDCHGLTSITIPSGVISIGEFAFRNCSGLLHIVVENGNTIYDSRDNCNAIIETSTNTLLFGCQSTIIPNSVTRIEDSAFRSSGLMSITIPSGVTSIGDRVFSWCTSLTSIICEAETPPTCGTDVFSRVPDSCILYVPAASVEAYQAASQWSDFTNIQAIPEPCEETSSEVSFSVCEGETFVWNGRTYYQSGTYVDTLSNWCGADSICTLNLTVLTPREEPMTDYMVCEADLPVMWHGRTLTTAGVYYDTLRYQATGCDSARYTLSLTVVKAIDIQADTTVCEADLPIIWRGRTLTTAGTYRDTLYDNVTGCDKERYTLNLTVLTPKEEPMTDSMVCEADLPVMWHGRTLTTAGVYYDTLRYQATGCDSARYTLSLTVVKAIDIQADTTVCEADLPIIWRGRTLTTAGTYRDTLYDNVTGCDRERYMLNLFVNSEQTSTEQDAICEGETYSWHGRSLTKTGVYMDTLQTVHGCDSVCTLNLTVNPSYLIEEIVSIREDKLPYLWQGRTLTAAGEYTAEYVSVHGCDSIHTLQLMVTALPIYKVDVLADHGHVNGTGTYPEGKLITLYAVPDEGFEFQMWSDGTTTNPKDFTVLQDTTFRAHFYMPEVEQEVTIDSIETNSVTITWDTVPGAVLYELRIYKNGELVVTYEIDPDNNIIGERFNGPDRLIARKDSTGGSTETLQVNVSGLESGQDYTYSLDALDDDRSYVGAQSGSFTTEEEPIDGLEETTENRDPRTRNPQKVLRNGVLYIEMPDGRIYDARGGLIVTM